MTAAVAVTLVVGSLWPTSAAAAPTRTVTYEVVRRGAVQADLDEFARTAAAVLGDARGWSLGGSVRFREVDRGGDMSLVLASPSAVAGASSACSSYYSCRVGRLVLVNDDRWRLTTPMWQATGGDVDGYRAYVINHEVGHFLGFGHAGCGGRGRTAPVMMQQSKGLAGCEPNAWPTRGERERLAARWGLPIHPWVFTDVLHGRTHTDADPDGRRGRAHRGLPRSHVPASRRGHTRPDREHGRTRVRPRPRGPVAVPRRP